MASLATAVLPGLTSLSLKANSFDYWSMSILVKANYLKFSALDPSYNRLDSPVMK